MKKLGLYMSSIITLLSVPPIILLLFLSFSSSGAETFVVPATKVCRIEARITSRTFGRCFMDEVVSGVQVIHNGPFVTVYTECKRLEVVCQDVLKKDKTPAQ